MYSKHIPYKKHFLKSITAILMSMAVLLRCQVEANAAPAAEISGSADILIQSYSAAYSSGANASMEADGDSRVIMHADLSKPGDWARFEFTVKNSGSEDAVLSDVIQSDKTPDNILISFGISKKDVGETLKPGEQCKISIVTQIDPEMTGEISAEEDFELKLVYEATKERYENGNGDISVGPKTSDTSHTMTALCTLMFAASIILLADKRRRA